MDVFFVNKLHFLHTNTEKWIFGHYSICQQENKEIEKGIQHVKAKYSTRGIQLLCWHADNEFNTQAIQTEILLSTLEPYVVEEHVGFIKRSIQEIKERTWATCDAVPTSAIKINDTGITHCYCFVIAFIYHR